MSESLLETDLAPLKAPFPWFGGKSTVASLVWKRFGNVSNYVEPFFGSGAMLLGRPRPFDGSETVNDADGLVSNFWRALQADPDAVAHHADWPVNENDLHARHAWLVGQKDSLQARLEGDPDFFNAKVAGWWVWGLSSWIAYGWCSGKGPWNVIEAEDCNRQLVHLGNAGQGIKRQLVHLGNAGQGINRQRDGDTCAEWSEHLRDMMQSLADRLRRVRICCGDWTRVCTETITVRMGLTAVFLDPPYADTAQRDSRIYSCDDLSVAHAVRKWALEQGDDPNLRIALCGYEGEHTMPASWECVAWKAKGGYASRRSAGDQVNNKRERIWFSPHCRKPTSTRQETLCFA